MEKLKMHSPDLIKENIAKIGELFPGCVIETCDESTGELRHSVDFEKLIQELSDPPPPPPPPLRFPLKTMCTTPKSSTPPP